MQCISTNVNPVYSFIFPSTSSFSISEGEETQNLMGWLSGVNRETKQQISPSSMHSSADDGCLPNIFPHVFITWGG